MDEDPKTLDASGSRHVTEDEQTLLPPPTETREAGMPDWRWLRALQTRQAQFEQSAAGR